MRTRIPALLLGAALAVPALHAEMTAQQRLEDFDHFWKMYRDSYVFFELKKEDHDVNWEAIGAMMRSRLKKSKTDLDLYRAVTEAQVLLRDGHCYNGSFQKIRETEPVFFQRIQFTLAESNKVAVAAVPPGSPFAQAGIQPGDELLSWDGMTVRQLAKRSRRYSAASSPGMFWHGFARQLYIHEPLLGKPKKPEATLVFRNAEGEQVTVKSKWNVAPPTGPQEAPAMMGFAEGIPQDGINLDQAEMVAIQGPLPMDVRIWKELNIGYLSIETWMKTEDPIEQMEAAMKAVQGTDGLIVDMRDNGGGVGPWGVLFTNYFIKAKEGKEAPNDSWMDRLMSKAFFGAIFPQVTSEELEQIFRHPPTIQYILGQLGVEITVEEVTEKYFQNGEFQPFYLRLLLNERKNTIKPYLKPVYVLSNGGCYSTTDIFMTILNEFKRIKVVGTPNGAGSGSPIPFQLPNSGLTVYVPHARAYPPFGSMIEGRPLKPVLHVAPSLEDLRSGKDTVLNAAAKALYTELHPDFGFAGGLEGVAPEFQLPEGESILKTVKEKAIDWGNKSTPDWALDAKIRALKLKDIGARRR